MESFNDVKTIVTVLNSASLLGITLYFYNEIKKIKETCNTQSQHLTNAIKKIQELQHSTNHISQLASAIKQINIVAGNMSNDIKKINNSINTQNNKISYLQSNMVNPSSVSSRNNSFNEIPNESIEERSKLHYINSNTPIHLLSPHTHITVPNNNNSFTMNDNPYYNNITINPHVNDNMNNIINDNVRNNINMNDSMNNIINDISINKVPNNTIINNPTDSKSGLEELGI